MSCAPGRGPSARAILPLLAALVGLAGCGPPPSPRLPAGTPVVLISIDTLRADRLPFYGYGDVETPRLAELARESVLFERAYSPYPLTLPAHASLLTGLRPPEHGVRDNIGFRLGEAPPTLAERLGAGGYRSAGFVSSMVLRRATGIGRGFEPFDDEMPPVSTRATARIFPEREGARTVARAREWLGGADPDAPLFLFVHLYEPHAPWEPPEPFRSRYEARPYDGEIAYADRLVGELLDALRERGLYERSLIVVLSDHGEGLGDHVETEHGLLLYREALEVPLLVRLPGGAQAGRRVAEPAALIDVAPTVLALLGLAHEDLPGQALLEAPPPAGRAIYAETFFGHHQYGWSPLRSIVRDSLHYIEAPRPELYDLAADPAERDNLLPRRAVPASMLEAMAEVGEGTGTRAGLDAGELERLASLGYVGGFSGAGEPGTGPDPKDGIGLAEELSSQVRRFGQHGSVEAEERALALMERLGVRNEFLSRTIANNLLVAGRAGRARDVLAPWSEGGDPATVQLAGQVEVALGRLDEAAVLFRRILERDTGHARARLGLGIVALARDRRAEARRELERAVELDPRLAEAWNTLGALCARQGDRACAVERWRRAVELDPELADAWYNLGVTLAAAGDRAGAIAALERYLPLASGRDRAEAERVLDRLGAAPG